MNSKEALKTIYINCKEKMVDENFSVCNSEDLIKTILQDLKRLEQLEDNIKIHKETIKMQQNQFESLQEENQKLEKAIEILKENHFRVEKNANTDYGYIAFIEADLTKEEYKLLKEVLEDE